MTPIDNQGPWNSWTRTSRPCPPCRARPATSVHRKGEPLGPRTARGSRPAPSRRSCGPRSPSTTAAPASTFRSRSCRSPRCGRGAGPSTRAPTAGRRSATSATRRGRGTRCSPGDDRTPTGVHEGLSCQACHAGHGQETRGFLRGLPPAPVQLRSRRREDGHDVPLAGQPARRPSRRLSRLPSPRRPEEEDRAPFLRSGSGPAETWRDHGSGVGYRFSFRCGKGRRRSGASTCRRSGRAGGAG